MKNIGWNGFPQALFFKFGKKKQKTLVKKKMQPYQENGKNVTAESFLNFQTIGFAMRGLKATGFVRSNKYTNTV